MSKEQEEILQLRMELERAQAELEQSRRHAAFLQKEYNALAADIENLLKTIEAARELI